MATDDPTPASAALASILAGMNATQGLEWYRASGGHVANQTWYALRGQLEAMIASREGNYNEPQNRKPVASEITRWDTQKARGYIQQVEVMVRERATNTLISVPYTSIGRQLRSRQAIAREALSVYSGEAAERYGQQILGAVYTSTYEARPVE